MTDLVNTKISVGTLGRMAIPAGSVVAALIGMSVWLNGQLVSLHSEVKTLHEENRLIMQSLKITPLDNDNGQSKYDGEPDLSKASKPRPLSADAPYAITR